MIDPRVAAADASARPPSDVSIDWRVVVAIAVLWCMGMLAIGYVIADLIRPATYQLTYEANGQLYILDYNLTVSDCGAALRFEQRRNPIERLAYTCQKES